MGPGAWRMGGLLRLLLSISMCGQLCTLVLLLLLPPLWRLGFTHALLTLPSRL